MRDNTKILYRYDNTHIYQTIKIQDKVSDNVPCYVKQLEMNNNFETLVSGFKTIMFVVMLIIRTYP